MARLDPAIRHAISPPEFGEDMLHRAELVDRLHGEIPKKLIAVAAPAGYGKTTLLTNFVAHTDIPVVWTQVTEADRDLMRFVSVLLASLEKRFRRLKDEINVDALSETPARAIASLIIDLLEREIPESFVIIIDDAHLLNASNECLDFLDQLVLGLPDQATVITSGREVVEVSLARLMAEGNLAGFGPHDLSLMREEVSKLVYKYSGKHPSTSELNELYETTQGWVTGIVLSPYISDQSISSALNESMIYEYLSSVVLNRQPDELRRFMLDTSVLPVMTPEACDALLEFDNSAEMLDELVEKHLFISYTSEGSGTYVFHPLFRRNLLDTLKAADKDKYIDLYKRGANYLSLDSPEIAIEMLLEIHEYDEAASLANKQAAELYRSGRYSTIDRWVDVFPENFSQLANLYYFKSHITASRGEYQEAIAILNKLLAEHSIPIEIKARAEAAKVRNQIQLGQIDQAKESIVRLSSIELELSDNSPVLARIIRAKAMYKVMVQGSYLEAAGILDKAISIAEAEGDNFLLAATFQDQALCYGLSGHLMEAKQATIRSHEIAVQIGSPTAQLSALRNLAQAELLTGDYQKALHLLEKARQTSKRLASPAYESEFVTYQAEIFRDVGMAVQAAELFGEGLDIASNLEDTSLASMACLAVATLHRRNGNFSQAKEWLNRSAALGTKGRNDHQQKLEQAAIIHHANPSEAINLLHELEEDESFLANAQLRVQKDYFLACSFFKKSRFDEALDRINDVLEQCEINSVTHYIASELNSSEDFLQWIEENVGESPLFIQVTTRIDILRRFKSHFTIDDVEKASPGGLEVESLGRAEIIWQGNPLDEIKPQALELLFLIIDQASIERDMIIEEFWSDHPPGRQTANLHMAIYSIRRELGKESIQLIGNAYQVNSAIDVRYDVEIFEKAVDVFSRLPPADPRRFFALTEAINAYKGRFLPEFFSDWVEERRRNLELKFLDIAAAYADEALLRGQPDRVLMPLRNALALDPYRDDLNERYMKALVRLDRRSEVIRHYREYSKLISEDLGLAPSNSVKEIHDRIISSR